jgi:hypothetical protein
MKIYLQDEKIFVAAKAIPSGSSLDHIITHK